MRQAALVPLGKKRKLLSDVGQELDEESNDGGAPQKRRKQKWIDK